MGAWDAWIGRAETRTDRIDEGLVARWLATFDRDAPFDGTLPQGIQWCLCLPDAPTAQLGTDGHPVRDNSQESFLPPVPLPRRMWAASKVDFGAPLKTGEVVSRTSQIQSINEKSGASGQLVFVDVAHETVGESGVAISEVQSIVYRTAAAADVPLTPLAPTGEGFDAAVWDAHHVITPNTPLLFRFSALTFNSHRIHYDLPYAQDEERYRGLVVHGPLMATLLLDLARQQFGDNALASFAFRGLSPAICDEPLHLAMRISGVEIELGAFANDGRHIMTASARKKV